MRSPEGVAAGIASVGSPFGELANDSSDQAEQSFSLTLTLATPLSLDEAAYGRFTIIVDASGL